MMFIQICRRTGTGFATAITIAAVVMVALLFLASSGTSHAQGGLDGSTDCAEIPPLTLTAGEAWSEPITQASPSRTCSFEASIGPKAAGEEGAAGASGTAQSTCSVTFTPMAMSGTAQGVRVSPEGSCADVEVRWSLSPSTPSAVGQSSSASGASGASGESQTTSRAYAYLLGEDAVGIDMIKNYAVLTWTHTSSWIYGGYYYPYLWGTNHEIRILDFYLGDGWTVESSNASYAWPSYPPYANHLRVWSNATFHAHLPVLADPRAITRSEVNGFAGGYFTCNFSLTWKNNYLFTSETYCIEWI